MHSNGQNYDAVGPHTREASDRIALPKNIASKHGHRPRLKLLNDAGSHPVERRCWAAMESDGFRNSKELFSVYDNTLISDVRLNGLERTSPGASQAVALVARAA